jgi:hypothetical protein
MMCVGSSHQMYKPLWVVPTEVHVTLWVVPTEVHVPKLAHCIA